MFFATPPESARATKVFFSPLTISALMATSFACKVTLSSTFAVLCTSAMFTPTAAATPVSALVLVAVERPCADASASLSAVIFA